MENEEFFRALVEQQNQYLNMLTMHLDRAERLLEVSEARIDRTNSMIEKLVECNRKHEDLTATITGEYCKHISSLTGNRDEISRQNTMLLELIKAIKSGIQLNQNFT